MTTARKISQDLLDSVEKPVTENHSVEFAKVV